MQQLYHQYLCGGPVMYMADLFGSMTGKKEESMQLALEFYSPMFLLYSMYDVADSKKKQEICDQQTPLLCSRCGGKTRLKLRKDTELKNFLLFCPKCKQETLVNVKDFKVITI